MQCAALLQPFWNIQPFTREWFSSQYFGAQGQKVHEAFTDVDFTSCYALAAGSVD